MPHVTPTNTPPVTATNTPLKGGKETYYKRPTIEANETYYTPVTATNTPPVTQAVTRLL